MHRRGCLALLLCCTLASPASAQPDVDSAPWSSIVAYGGKSPWEVRTGTASVTVRGGRIAIAIRDPSGRPTDEIAGTYSASKLRVTRRLLSSDVPEERMTGSYTRHTEGGTTYEVITLGNAYSLIGVNRVSVNRSAKP